MHFPEFFLPTYFPLTINYDLTCNTSNIDFWKLRKVFSRLLHIFQNIPLIAVFIQPANYSEMLLSNIKLFNKISIEGRDIFEIVVTNVRMWESSTNGGCSIFRWRRNKGFQFGISRFWEKYGRETVFSTLDGAGNYCKK